MTRETSIRLTVNMTQSRDAILNLEYAELDELARMIEQVKQERSSPFLRLPVEMRVQIYGHVLDGIVSDWATAAKEKESHGQWDSMGWWVLSKPYELPSVTSMLLVCREMSDEIRPLLHNLVIAEEYKEGTWQRISVESTPMKQSADWVRLWPTIEPAREVVEMAALSLVTSSTRRRGVMYFPTQPHVGGMDFYIRL